MGVISDAIDSLQEWCENLFKDGIKKPFEVSHNPATQKLFEPVCEPVGEKIHKRLP